MEPMRVNVGELQRPSANSVSKSRATPAVVARQGEILFSAYRSDQYADPRGFAVQLATVLSEFPDDVVMFVTSPQTGIQRRSKWPPTISEILEACEAHEEYLRRQRAPRPAKQLPPQSEIQREPGHLANVFVPQNHPRYAKLVEWTQGANPALWSFRPSSDGRAGVWVSVDVWHHGAKR